MSTTPYAKDTTVTVPPCSIHADVPGRVLSRHVMREIRTDNHEAIVEYWIRFEDGELCLHPHVQVQAKCPCGRTFGDCDYPDC